MAILIVVAHPLEAEHMIKQTQAKQVSDHLYLYDGGKILISGMGSIAAASQTALHAHDVDEIWNIGIAGSLNDAFETGKTYEVGTITKHLSLPQETDEHTTNLAIDCHPTLTINQTGACLISSDYPIWDNALRNRLGQTTDIVDMEGYGIAKVATLLNLPCRIYKVISDQASNKEYIDLQSRISDLMKEMIAHTPIHHFSVQMNRASH